MSCPYPITTPNIILRAPGKSTYVSSHALLHPPENLLVLFSVPPTYCIFTTTAITSLQLPPLPSHTVTFLPYRSALGSLLRGQLQQQSIKGIKAPRESLIPGFPGSGYTWTRHDGLPFPVAKIPGMRRASLQDSCQVDQVDLSHVWLGHNPPRLIIAGVQGALTQYLGAILSLSRTFRNPRCPNVVAKER